MTLPWVKLLFTAAFLGVVTAQSSSANTTSSTLLTTLAQLPLCVTTCSLQELSAANCLPTDIRNCLCTNNTMQSDLAICVQRECNITEQTIALTVAQQDICEGIPQPSRSWEVILCVIVISVVTFPVIFLRCLSRYIISKRLWWDDWLAIFCGVILVPMAVIPILNAMRGFGKHFYNIPPQNIPLLRELYYVSQVFYSIVHPAAKTSILLFYLRAFPNEKFQRITKISILWMVLHTIAFFLAVTFQCVPVKIIWETTLPGKCTNLVAIIYTGAAVSIVEDLIVMLLPLPQLRGLRLSQKKKIGLVFMFSLGSFACFASMIRLKFIIEFNSSVDLTWDDVDLTIWSIIEVYTAVICSSLIPIRPLLVRYLPKLFSTTQNSKSGSGLIKGLSDRVTGKVQSSNKIEERLTGDEPTRYPESNISEAASVTTADIELADGTQTNFPKHPSV